MVAGDAYIDGTHVVEYKRAFPNAYIAGFAYIDGDPLPEVVVGKQLKKPSSSFDEIQARELGVQLDEIQARDYNGDPDETLDPADVDETRAADSSLLFPVLRPGKTQEQPGVLCTEVQEPGRRDCWVHFVTGLLLPVLRPREMQEQPGVLCTEAQ